MILSEADGLSLIRWFEKNKRQMAWRDDPTPYHVWVSEIMLQQTRVDTVHAYYRRFMETFPTVVSLAEADEDALLKKWEGLGYYSRARNLQKAAKTVVSAFGGEIPASYAELEKLPGIGSYTAGAILSIAFHEKVPVVDGNVLRVLMRFLGRTDDVRDPKTKGLLEKELGEFLLKTDVDPSAFNQGLMELGALVCIPNGKPKCAECPWRGRCKAFREGCTDSLPVISPKAERKTERKTVFLLYVKDRLALVKREGQGVLSGLYGLPAADGKIGLSAVRKAFRKTGAIVRSLPEKTHVFTHKTWLLSGYRIDAADYGKIKEAFSRLIAGKAEEPAIRPVWVTEKELEDSYSLPAAFRKWPLFEEISGDSGKTAVI